LNLCELRLQSQLKTHGSETYKNADVFIRDLLQIINKFAALLIGMASPYQILDWYGGRHTCHTASGALAAGGVPRVLDPKRVDRAGCVAPFYLNCHKYGCV